MKSLRILALVGFAALIGAASLSGIRADEWDKTTIVTVNEPVQIPGTVLQPGTYTFRLMESPSDRHIVQVFNADGTKLSATDGRSGISGNHGGTQSAAAWAFSLE